MQRMLCLLIVLAGRWPICTGQNLARNVGIHMAQWEDIQGLLRITQDGMQP